jgi:hypothetical protein
VRDAVLLRVREAREHAFEHADDPRLCELAHPRPERAALEVLHGDERNPVVQEAFEHADDARVLERGPDLCLPHETGGDGRVVAAQIQSLERRDPVQCRLARAEHDGRVAACDRADDLVTAGASDCLQRVVVVVHSGPLRGMARDATRKGPAIGVARYIRARAAACAAPRRAVIS